MEAESIQITHASPGRIRLKVTEVKDNPSLAEGIRRRLVTVRGIQQVQTNPLTGSILIRYDPAGFTSPDSLLALADSLNAAFPGVNLRKLAETWLAQARNEDTSTPSLAQSISGALGVINARVGDATGGTDLKVLLPLSLFFFGVRSLLVSKPLPVPTWYDFLWFALSTFVMLNSNVVEGDR